MDIDSKIDYAIKIKMKLNHPYHKQQQKEFDSIHDTL